MFQNIDWGKNVVIFGAENSSSVHTNNEKKDILVLGKGPRQRLDDTTLSAEKEYAINFSDEQKKFCLRLHHYGANVIHLLTMLKNTN